MDMKRFILEEKEKYINFGLSVTSMDIISRVSKSPMIYKYKHNVILKYLKKNYSYILDNYRSIDGELAQISKDYPIWVFWYQGFNNAPPIVKACLNSLKKCVKGHPIIEITKDNIADYVVIPSYILNKLQNSTITITHLSDILRVLLLEKYGGCWVDVTLFFEKWIQEDLSTMSFYSLKQNPVTKNSMYVSDYKWATYFQIHAKGSITAKYMRDIFLAYLEKEQCFVDYFLMDYFLALGYEEIPVVRDAIDHIPINNPNVAWLNTHMSDVYNIEEYRKINLDTVLFKLSWKINYKEKDNSYLNYVLTYLNQ